MSLLVSLPRRACPAENDPFQLIRENKMFTTFTDWEFDGNIENATQNAKTLAGNESCWRCKYARDSYWSKFNQNDDTLEQKKKSSELGQD